MDVVDLARKAISRHTAATRAEAAEALVWHARHDEGCLAPNSRLGEAACKCGYRDAWAAYNDLKAGGQDARGDAGGEGER